MNTQEPMAPFLEMLLIPLLPAFNQSHLSPSSMPSSCQSQCPPYTLLACVRALHFSKNSRPVVELLRVPGTARVLFNFHNHFSFTNELTNWCSERWRNLPKVTELISEDCTIPSSISPKSMLLWLSRSVPCSFCSLTSNLSFQPLCSG